MGIVEIILIGAGLAMDAFAVSICKGLAMPKLNMKQALVIGLFFGIFQAGMPAIGWLLGTQFESYITAVDHWIAFILLAFIGGKMLWDCFHEDDDEEEASTEAFKLDIKELFLLAIATSIDAFAVGITFAFLHVDLVLSVSVIGIVTFCLSVVGVALGHFFGSRYERPAQIAGGVVLILIGLKILLEHLGILVF